MKSLASTVFLLPFFLATALAGDTPELESYRVRVLYTRVHNVLAHRQAALNECAARAPSSLLFDFNAALKTELARPASQASGESLAELLALMQETLYWQKPERCQNELSKYDGLLWRRERAKFQSGALFVVEGSVCLVGFGLGRGTDCVKTIQKLRADLDPHCAVEVAADRNGATETNPCFAGDRMVNQALWQSGHGRDKVFAEIDSFLWSFYHAVEQAAPGAMLDYASFYRLGDRKLLLGLLAFFSASSTSTSGYVDGFGEHVWREALWRGERPQSIITRYHDLKRRKDLYRDLLAMSAKKSLRLTLAGTATDLTEANRHDFMAAFLACHYRASGQVAASKLLPRFLGYGYESLDFVSHIKNGVSLSRSLDNFDEDTDRYSRATRWGSRYCSSL